jgi:hypothetical protein
VRLVGYLKENTKVHFVGYLCVMDLINARKMKHIKTNESDMP